MKAKKAIISIIIIITIIIVITILATIGYNMYKENHYNKIIKAIDEAVQWELKATNVNGNRQYDSDYLIQQGYLKKEDIKDLDSKSYCKARMIFSKGEDHPTYKIYIKCKDYKTKGYYE